MQKNYSVQWGEFMIIKTIITLILLTAIRIFAVPLPKSLNIGNLYGMISSAFLIFYINFQSFIKSISFLNIACTLVFYCIIAFTFLGGIFSLMMLKQIKTKPKNCRCCIVLGCKVIENRPSRMLRKRLDKAVEYLNENPQAVCIVSGGQGRDEMRTEAEVMREYLIKNGISESRILCETKSTSTFENFAFSKKLFGEHFNQPIAVITDGYHQYRASLIAKMQGISTCSLSSFTEPLFLPTYWVREWFGIVFLKIRRLLGGGF